MRCFSTALWGILLMLPLGSTLAQVATPSPPTTIMIPGLRNRPPRILADTMGNPFEVPAPAAKVFAAATEAYQDLKIDIVIRDSVQLQVGNPIFDRRGNVAGKRMSLYVECGEDMMGSRADFNRIDLSLISFIKPAGNSAAVLRTVLLASAANVGVRGDLPCSTTGELERRLYQLVLKKLGISGS